MTQAIKRVGVTDVVLRDAHQSLFAVYELTTCCRLRSN